MSHTSTLNHSPAISDENAALKRSVLLDRRGAGAHPCRRTQFGNRLQAGQFGARLPVGKLRQHIQQVLKRINFQPFAGTQHRQDGRDLRARAFTADLDPIFASKLDPKNVRCVWVVAAIGKLYDIERQAREEKLMHSEREAMRARGCPALLAALKALISETGVGVPPKSALGKACVYALNQWERVERYAGPGHGMVETSGCLKLIR